MGSAGFVTALVTSSGKTQADFRQIQQFQSVPHLDVQILTQCEWPWKQVRELRGEIFPLWAARIAHPGAEGDAKGCDSLLSHTKDFHLLPKSRITANTQCLAVRNTRN